jgi:hypothetical protein
MSPGCGTVATPNADLLSNGKLPDCTAVPATILPPLSAPPANLYVEFDMDRTAPFALDVGWSANVGGGECMVPPGSMLVVEELFLYVLGDGHLRGIVDVSTVGFGAGGAPSGTYVLDDTAVPVPAGSCSAPPARLPMDVVAGNP